MKKNSRSPLMLPAMQARKDRLELLLGFVKNIRQRRRDLVPRFAVEWGLSQEKVHEYVQVLIDAGRLEVGKDGYLQQIGQRLPFPGPGPGRRTRPGKELLKGKHT